MKTILKFITGGLKNVVHLQNVPIIGDAVEEYKSEDGGENQFSGKNFERLVRKYLRYLLIAITVYLILAGKYEKAEKVQKEFKKIELVK